MTIRTSATVLAALSLNLSNALAAALEATEPNGRLPSRKLSTLFKTDRSLWETRLERFRPWRRPPAPPSSFSRRTAPCLHLRIQWPASPSLPFDRRSLAQLVRFRGPRPALAPLRSVQPKFSFLGRLAPALPACFGKHPTESCSLASPTDCHSGLSSSDRLCQRPDSDRGSLFFSCSQASSKSPSNVWSAISFAVPLPGRSWVLAPRVRRYGNL